MKAKNQGVRWRRTPAALAMIALLGGSTACSVGAEGGENNESENAPEIAASTQSLTSSPTGGKYQALQDYLARQSRSTTPIGAQTSLSTQGVQAAAAAAGGGGVDTLAGYAAKCDIATGVHVPAFSCENGTEVPGQGNGVTCDKPNVLNNECDPGSKFQVLVRTPDAIVVAHCRKDGQPVAGTIYNDVAVIQYNKANGAECFYQALIGVQGATMPAPSSGAAPWYSPTATEAIRCTGCHDNGGLIRSPYLAQLTTGQNAFPNSSTGFDNQSIPVKYVGLDFALNKSWSITGPTVVGTGAPCVTCHRLAVSNYQAFNRINGSAGHFATQATDAQQSAAKNPHGPASPIWMRPGQIFFDANANASALKFEACANGYWSGQSDGFSIGTPTAGCAFTPLATGWDGLDPAQVVAVLTNL